jgi:hypothetical protein
MPPRASEASPTLAPVELLRPFGKLLSGPARNLFQKLSHTSPALIPPEEHPLVALLSKLHSDSISFHREDLFTVSGLHSLVALYWNEFPTGSNELKHCDYNWSLFALFSDEAPFAIPDSELGLLVILAPFHQLLPMSAKKLCATEPELPPTLRERLLSLPDGMAAFQFAERTKGHLHELAASMAIIAGDLGIAPEELLGIDSLPAIPHYPKRVDFFPLPVPDEEEGTTLTDLGTVGGPGTLASACDE